MFRSALLILSFGLAIGEFDLSQLNGKDNVAAFKLSDLSGKLIKQDGTNANNSALDDKDGIFIYFSAHWCPLCREFTPVLKDFYEEYSQKRNFEIVFVSSDIRKEDMMSYFAEMAGYLALDFGEAVLAKTVKEHFKVTSIPVLVFLKGDGAVRIKNASTQVQSGGSNYPWGA